MTQQTQPLYKLNPPYLNGYILDLEKSQKENANRLQQYSHTAERKRFFLVHNNNFLLKKLAKWEWFVFALALLFSIPLWQIYNHQVSVDIIGIIFFHIPLSILILKYVLIELFVSYKASHSPYIKELQQFYAQNWLEIHLFPYLEKVYLKIQETKNIINQLSEQHLKTLTFTETPNIHNDLLTQTRGQLTHLEQIIKAYQNALYTFESLEKELFILKQNKDQQNLLFQSMQNIPNQQTQKRQKEGYIKRFKQLKQFTQQAQKHYALCNTQPQQAVQEYTNLVQKIITHT